MNVCQAAVVTADAALAALAVADEHSAVASLWKICGTSRSRRFPYGTHGDRGQDVRTSPTMSDNEEIETHLDVHRGLLATTDSPLPIDDREGDTSNALPAGLSDLLLDLRQEFVRFEEIKRLPDPRSNTGKVSIHDRCRWNTRATPEIKTVNPIGRA